MRSSLLAFVLLLAVSPAYAQTPAVIAVGCSAVLPQANKLGDTLVLVQGPSRQAAPPVDFNGNTWQQAQIFQTYYGGYVTVWYALNVKAGVNTVTLPKCDPSVPQNLVLLEEPPTLAPDQMATYRYTGSGAGTSATAGPVTTTAAGELLIAWGYNDRPPLTITAGDGFTLEGVANGQLGVEDQQVNTAGAYSATIKFSPGTAPSAGLVTFPLTTPPPPPPPPDLINVNISAKLLWCTVCDGSDDTPMSGSLRISQQQTSSTFGINADGTLLVNAAINVGVDPVDFTFSLLDGSGAPVPGTGLEWVIPQAQIQANAGFILGTLGLPPMRFAHGANGPVFKGFVVVTVPGAAN